MAEQGSLAALAGQARFNLGHVMAHEGRLDEAEDVLVTARDGVTTTNWDRLRTAEALGFVALSRGDPVTAARHLDRWYAVLTAMHLGEPGYSRSYLDYLEALVATGRLDDAAGFPRLPRRPGGQLRAALGRGDRDDRAGDGGGRERPDAAGRGRRRAGLPLV